MVRMQLRHNQEIVKESATQAMGNTPMHMAARQGHYLVVKYLLEIGAYPLKANFDQKTPKDLLVKAMMDQGKRIKKLTKKPKVDPVQLKQAEDRYKAMQDTFELLSYKEQEMGGAENRGGGGQ